MALAAGLMACAVLTTAQAQVPTGASTWTLALPAGGHIRYEGMVNFDNAGMQQGSMLYPAPGLIGLVVAVATHSAIATSVRNAEKTRLQEEADAVLRPYLGVIERLTDETVAQNGLARMTGSARGQWQSAPSSATAPAQWRVEGLPVFRLTQDQTAFILDHAIRVQQGDSASPPVFEGTVRVVSTPLGGESPQDRWLAEDGQRLRDTLAELYARSLEIALQRAGTGTSASPGTMRTVRYDEGRNSRVERARVIDAGCDRWLVENLRGWLLSVPVHYTQGPACTETIPQPR